MTLQHWWGNALRNAEPLRNRNSNNRSNSTRRQAQCAGSSSNQLRSSSVAVSNPFHRAQGQHKQP